MSEIRDESPTDPEMMMVSPMPPKSKKRPMREVASNTEGIGASVASAEADSALRDIVSATQLKVNQAQGVWNIPTATAAGITGDAPIAANRQRLPLSQRTDSASAPGVPAAPASSAAAGPTTEMRPADLPPPGPVTPLEAALFQGRQKIARFLRERTCYDLMPESSKVLVLDVRVPLRLAFFALVENGVSSAPLWDQQMQCHVGLFSSTEFITILRHFKSTNSIAQNLLSHSIGSWLSIRPAAVRALLASPQATISKQTLNKAQGPSLSLPPVASGLAPVLPTTGVASGNSSVAAAEPAASIAPPSGTGAEVVAPLMAASAPVSSASPMSGVAGDAGATATATTTAAAAAAAATTAVCAAGNGAHTVPVPSLGTTMHTFLKLMDSQEFLSISVEASLYEACSLLRRWRIHRIPAVDPEEPASVLSIMTHMSMLRYIVQHLREPQPLFHASIQELRIGTFGSAVLTATQMTPLIRVLEMLWTHRVSAIPIVDDAGVVVDIYSKTDVMFLCRIQQKYEQHLEMPVSAELGMLKTEGVRESRHEGLQLCKLQDSLKSVVERFAGTSVHRLVAVDSRGFCVAVVSLSDLFKWFLDESDR